MKPWIFWENRMNIIVADTLAVLIEIQGLMPFADQILHITLQWRHYGRNSVSNHQPHDCLLKRLFRRRSKKTSKLRVTGLCVGNSPGTGEFPTQMASNTANVSIWWHHHDESFSLTHWGRVTHICVSKLIIIGSDNGLSPGWRQAIIWTNAGILWIGPLGTNFSEIFIEIHMSSFKKMHWKMSSAKCRPSCLGLNVIFKDRTKWLTFCWLQKWNAFC